MELKAPKLDNRTHNEASPLVKALEQRKRETWDFDAANMMTAGDKPLGKYKLRVATKAEQDRAIVQAHAYVLEMAGKETPASRDDDILTEVKTAHILHAVCRDADKPDVFSAFPSPKWMMDHLSTDELAVLLNNYNTVLGKCGVWDMDTSDERVEAYISMCANMASTDVPDVLLSACNREYLIYLLVRVCQKLVKERKEYVDAGTPELSFVPLDEVMKDADV